MISPLDHRVQSPFLSLDQSLGALHPATTIKNSTSRIANRKRNSAISANGKRRTRGSLAVAGWIYLGACSSRGRTAEKERSPWASKHNLHMHWLNSGMSIAPLRTDLGPVVLFAIVSVLFFASLMGWF